MDTSENCFCGVSEMPLAILEYSAGAENKEISKMAKLIDKDWEKTKDLWDLTNKEQGDVLDYVALHSPKKADRIYVLRTRKQVKAGMSKNALASRYHS